MHRYYLRRDGQMSLHEPRRRHETNHLQRLLDRLQRELSERGRKTSSYADVCDMVAIPRDLRASLLKTLVSKGYVKTEGSDQISITPAGTKLASSPFS
jgi:DNA-binding IclR family transcriptional regulator